MAKNNNLTDFLKGIADKLRSKLSTTALINPQDFETKIDDVYTQGKKDNNSEFWDAYAQHKVVNEYYTGTCAYFFAGYGWNNETYNPPFNFKPTSCYNMFRTNYTITLPFKCSRPDSVNRPLLDTSNCSNLAYFIAESNVAAIPTIDTRKSASLSHFIFYSTITTIDKLILKDDGSQVMDAFVTGNTQLTNITIEGVIGYNGLDFSSCGKLTHNSLLSIINALKDYSNATVHTLRIHPTSLTLLSDTELAIATAKNWSISAGNVPGRVE